MRQNRQRITVMVDRSKKACHTCRRRRLKCDLGKPLCQRCKASGVECLGYDNLILWVDGVASRGKMMGKSYRQSSNEPFNTSMTPVTASSPRTTHNIFIHHLGNHDIANTNILYHSLLDPWLQKLDGSTRHYLVHFLVNVGNDLVVYNLPSQKQNPLRMLLEFADRKSVLFQILIAMSAFHMHNLLPSTSDPHNHYIDALRAKGRALILLNRELGNLSTSNHTTLLASLMLLAELALLESGDDTWRLHVSAAAQPVRSGTMPCSSSMKDLEPEEHSFRSWAISRLILQDTFGCSLSSLEANWQLRELGAIFHGIDSSLRYAEFEHYTSCPLHISQLILTASSMYDTGAGSSCCTQLAQCPVLSIQQFNPSTWTMQLQSLTPTNDSTERYHVGSAYKAAATLYIAQIVPDGSSCSHIPLRGQDLIDEILYHVSQISRNHPLYKSIIWPLYIAGAESTDPQRREAVMQHLRSLSRAIPWQSMLGAEQVLKDFWDRIDSMQMPSSDTLTRQKWLAEFRAMGVAIYPA